ncbi:MAG: hypothetical protein AABX69_02870, partial [Nanoarchaeota archaeon]
TLQCRAENNPLGQVCRARQNLDKTLEKLEWAKVTTRKEDAQGRVAPGLPAPPQQPPPVQELRPKTQTKITTVPEKPLPGELFKLVVTAESANPVKWLRMTTNLKAGLKSTKWSEWNVLPCDWVSKSCKREWTGLFFDPKPTGIRVSLIDALDTYSEITPPGGFIPTVSDNCLENHNAGEKWAGCRNENNEVLYECGADGKTKLIPADRPMSFLCRGGSLIGPFIDYGGTDAVGQGDCIYSCRFDVECRAAGGSVEPYTCKPQIGGYGATKERYGEKAQMKRLCCDIRVADEINSKTIGVLIIATSMIDQEIALDSVGPFFIFDIVNPIKMFLAAKKIVALKQKQNVLKKLLEEAEQGTRLSMLVSVMSNLKAKEKERNQYLTQKYKALEEQFKAYDLKLDIDRNDPKKSNEEREKARVAKSELGVKDYIADIQWPLYG